MFASEIRFESPDLKKTWCGTWKQLGMLNFHQGGTSKCTETPTPKKKRVDPNGIVAECFVYGCFWLHVHLFRLFNLMLVGGHVEKGLKQTNFSMIRK